MKRLSFCFGVILVMGAYAGAAQVPALTTSAFEPGKPWLDEAGNVINAHGGGIFFAGDRYFWVGEKRGREQQDGITVYSSTDLSHWQYQGMALVPSEDTTSDIARGCLMERPKVIYNEKTHKYVLWFHLELRGKGYAAARAGVAVSDRPEGPYTFLKSFRPNGNMSRDMNLFVDEDGTAYQLYSSRENYDMRVVRLSDDYLSPTTADSLAFSKHREAPAAFKYQGKYYLITSACTGWAPNEADMYTASSMLGPWKLIGNPLRGPDASRTYEGQSTCILPVQGRPGAYIFMADRWNPHNLIDSRYIWLPVQFQGDIPFIDWRDKWNLSVFPHSFSLGDRNFQLDGRPFQVISGEMHYTRIPREAWRDRMRMAKAMGLNTIGTYVFWNASEPEPGKFDFTGNNDVAAFVKTAREEGLWVILRPSPYVCAEWEFGGYPYWLENVPGLVVRSRDSLYLKEYRAYMREVGKQLAGLQVNHGGNILMVQIENEYGSYGNDKEYLNINRKMFIDAGFDGLLFTCDPPQDLAAGYLPGLLPAVNALDDPPRVMDTVNKYHGGKGPYYLSEWYPAWFDWWGAPHHTVPAAGYAGRLDSVLGAGLSINMYMFHGGTTRGFMNGANYNDHNPFEPQISSYDYDAPLDEAGNATPKFMVFRKVIQKHLSPGVVLPDVPAPKPTITIPPIAFSASVPLFDLLPAPRHADTPLSFEDLHQAYGFVLYRTNLSGRGSGSARLTINGLRDYAIVFLNGKKEGVLDRRLSQNSLQLEVPASGATLDILVENLGRINFGKYLLQNKKGIIGTVTLAGRALKNWDMFGLPFDTVPGRLSGKKIEAGIPVLKKGTFTLDKTGDTYLDMRLWGKGLVWVNGHNLGRYWQVGPQQTLYVPAEWLKTGMNDIEVLELLKPGQQTLRGLREPVLNDIK